MGKVNAALYVIKSIYNACYLYKTFSQNVIYTPVLAASCPCNLIFFNYCRYISHIQQSQ